MDLKVPGPTPIGHNILSSNSHGFLSRECAGSLKCPLITLDRGMQRIAREMGILVLE